MAFTKWTVLPVRAINRLDAPPAQSNVTRSTLRGPITKSVWETQRHMPTLGRNLQSQIYNLSEGEKKEKNEDQTQPC